MNKPASASPLAATKLRQTPAAHLHPPLAYCCVNTLLEGAMVPAQRGSLLLREHAL